MLNVDLKRLVIMEIFCLFINLQCYILYIVWFFSESNIKRIYRAKFDDWCEYFDKGKVLQNQYVSILLLQYND